jgi:DNA invertase Pin-like site-specific DNA recombinase
MRVTEKNEPKKALGYLRISDKKQIKGESLANQREAIRSYAYDKDIEVVDWFTDEAKSGKNADRQALQELIVKAAKMKGQIDYVLVYKMNRASRDIDSYVMVIKSQLSALGIRIQSVTEQFDDSPMGHFIENLHVMV